MQNSRSLKEAFDLRLRGLYSTSLFEKIKIKINAKNFDISQRRWWMLSSVMKINVKDELFNVTRAWDKENIWVCDRNRTHDLLNTWRVLYPLSYENPWRARFFNWDHVCRVPAMCLGGHHRNQTHDSWVQFLSGTQIFSILVSCWIIVLMRDDIKTFSGYMKARLGGERFV